tara:strand:+ start:20 stop:181 length:162 start_codon:yes stop_codon:yes gene_type:complete
MKAYDVILEHKHTQKIQFVKIEECVDMDECIDHVHECFPEWQIERISPIKEAK